MHRSPPLPGRAAHPPLAGHCLSQSDFASVKQTMGGALVGLDTEIYGNVYGGAAFRQTTMNAALASLAGHTNGIGSTFWPPNSGAIGASFSTQINRRWSWYFNAATQAACGREHDVTANAGIEYRF